MFSGRMMLRGRSPVLFLPPGPCLGEGRKKAKAGERGLEDAGKADKRLKEDNVGRESDRGDSMEVGQLEGKKTGKLCRNLGNREGSEKKSFFATHSRASALQWCGSGELFMDTYSARSLWKCCSSSWNKIEVLCMT